MNNINTCTDCPDLVITIVMFMHGELLKFICDMVHRTGVEVSVWIDNIRRRCHSSKANVRDELFIKSIPTYVGSVARLHVDVEARGLDCLLEELVDDPGHHPGLE
jgi:hypothetical protein